MGELEELTEKIIEEGEQFALDDPADERSVSGQVLELLLNTRELCQMMENLIKNQVEEKDKLINKLHTELENYRQGNVDRFIDAVMKEIIKVIKDMKNQLSSEHWKDISAEELKKQYTYIFEDLTDLLERQNINSYSTEAGTVFDRAIHQPKIEATEDESLDKVIKKSLSDGYMKGEKVLLPEKVIVYQYRK